MGDLIRREGLDVQVVDSATATRLEEEVRGTSYDPTAADVDVPCYYWIKADNTGGTSDFSASAEGIRLPLPQIPGDANNSSTVDAEDVKILASNWGKSGMTWGDGDFNADGVVSAIDAAILAAHFGMTLPQSGEQTPIEPLAPCTFIVALGSS